MKKTKTMWSALVLCAVGAGAIETGPEVGTRIPPFTAQDQTGETRSFEDLRGPNGLLILFHRTADW